MSSLKTINLGSAAEQAAKTAHGSEGVRAGSLIFVSGQAAITADGEVLFPDDVGAQTRHAVARFAEILANEGATLNDIASVSVFLNASSDFAEFNAAYAEAFGSHRPSRTTVEAKLVVTGLLVEMSAIAVVSDRAI